MDKFEHAEVGPPIHHAEDATAEEFSREYLDQHPTEEVSLWMGWVQNVCRWENIPQPTGLEWDALLKTWHPGKVPVKSADELVALRKAAQIL